MNNKRQRRKQNGRMKNKLETIKSMENSEIYVYIYIYVMKKRVNKVKFSLGGARNIRRRRRRGRSMSRRRKLKLLFNSHKFNDAESKNISK